ncbi:MAG: Permease of the drug/metabolite transporter superfamily [Chthonomonadaceae bacterium]|nr:Permease of the drug/metabolite transporter superfamily [Chthonomonadaceae bacterium]
MSDQELVEVVASPPRQISKTLTVGAICALVGINLLWSASTVASKNALDVFGPLTLTALRFAPAGLILLGMARSEGKFPEVRRRDWTDFFLLALLGIVLTYGIYYTGVARTTASEAVLLTACEPILIALFARIFLHEYLSRQQWIGLWVGLVGIWLIVERGSTGNIIALIALCIETTASVTAKRLTSRYPGVFVVSIEMLLGSLLILPGVAWELAHHPPALSWGVIGSVLYLSLICSAVGYGVWFRLMERYPVSVLGAFILIQPLFGPLSGWLFRHEVLTTRGALGAALVILGVGLNALRRSKPASDR